ncbi:MAG: methyltransferase domain-containing protein, partial [Acidobacteriota bacterium]
AWLVDLLAFRVPERQLFGVEVDPTRAAAVKGRLPAAGLAVIGGTRLPWRGESFDVVVASTVFTSILDSSVQRALAAEITRVLKPGGALLWYDFAFSNPRNPHVRGLPERRLRELFPALRGAVQRVTLAPPILRRVAPWSLTLTQLLSALPFLRSHLLGVLLKGQRPTHSPSTSEDPR